MRIDRRFNGPPTSGNGGVSCGLLAAYVDAPAVEVTLRQPPPLEVDMRVENGELYDGDLLIATAVPGTVDVEPPPPVTVEQAVAAEPSFAGFVDHPFPGCFVCGTDRPAPDGLGLPPGPGRRGPRGVVLGPADGGAVSRLGRTGLPGRLVE